MLGRYNANIGNNQPAEVTLTPEEEALYQKKKKQTAVVVLLAIPLLFITMGAFEFLTKKLIGRD